MENVAEIIQQPMGQMPAAHADQKDQSLRECVKQALDNYFAQLDGEPPAQLHDMVLEQIELPLLQKVMEFTGNNQSKAAKILGLSRGTLRKKLKMYDLL